MALQDDAAAGGGEEEDDGARALVHNQFAQAAVMGCIALCAAILWRFISFIESTEGGEAGESTVGGEAGQASPHTVDSI